MKRRLPFAGLVLLHAFLLSFDLTADPPRAVDATMGLYADEGWKTYAARNKALFGAWQPREGLSRGWLHRSPLPTLAWWASFETFGVSRAAARLPNLLFSLGSLCLVYATARRVWRDARVGVLAAALYVLDFNLLMFARLAFQETQVAFWLLLALYAWTRAEDRVGWAAAAAAALAAAFLSKASALLAFPAFLVAVAAAAFGSPASRRRATVFFGALLALAAGWWLLWAAPRPAETAAAAADLAGRLGPAASPLAPLLTAATVLDNGYMTRSLPVFLAALAGCLLTLLRGRSASSAEWIATLWLAGGLAGFALLPYRPARYFPILGPAALLATVSFAAHGPAALRAAWRARGGTLQRAAFAAALLAGGFLAAYAALGLAPPRRGYLAAAAVGGVLCALAALRFLLRGTPAVLRGSPRTAILLCAMGFFVIPYARWICARTHALVSAGRLLDAAVPPEATLGGYEAVMLALETRAYVGDVDNPPGRTPSLSEKLRRVRPDYVATTAGAFAELDPALREGARFVRPLPLPPPFSDAGLWRLAGGAAR